jgi:acetyl-CoA carboxylase beta subunit
VANGIRFIDLTFRRTNVAKPSWGKKLKCQSCGAAFYDMNAIKPVCPKCETEYAPVVKGRRNASAPAAAPKKPLVAKTDEETESEDVLLDDDDDLDATLEEEEDDDNDDESIIDDTSDLDDDVDDMAEIKEHVEVDLDNKD